MNNGLLSNQHARTLLLLAKLLLFFAAFSIHHYAWSAGKEKKATNMATFIAAFTDTKPILSRQDPNCSDLTAINANSILNPSKQIIGSEENGHTPTNEDRHNSEHQSLNINELDALLIESNRDVINEIYDAMSFIRKNKNFSINPEIVLSELEAIQESLHTLTGPNITFAKVFRGSDKINSVLNLWEAELNGPLKTWAQEEDKQNHLKEILRSSTKPIIWLTSSIAAHLLGLTEAHSDLNILSFLIGGFALGRISTLATAEIEQNRNAHKIYSRLDKIRHTLQLLDSSQGRDFKENPLFIYSKITEFAFSDFAQSLIKGKVSEADFKDACRATRTGYCFYEWRRFINEKIKDEGGQDAWISRNINLYGTPVVLRKIEVHQIFYVDQKALEPVLINIVAIDKGKISGNNNKKRKDRSEEKEEVDIKQGWRGLQPI